ncbi:MAG: hypothetical protein WD670_06185, partial [Actinomycetota bacterium]
MVLSELAWAELEECHPVVASDLAREGLAIAEQVADPLATRIALSILSTAEMVLGRPSRKLVERGVALEGSAVAGETSWAAIAEGRQRLWAGDVRSARAALMSALDRCLDQGREAASWEIIANLAEVEFRSGRWDRAARYAGEALEIALDIGRRNVSGEILAISAAIAAAMGHDEQARADGLEALSVSERAGDRWIELVARSALGFLELSRGDAAAAHTWLAPVAETCDEMGLREPGVFPFVPDAVEALITLGEIDGAERLTDRLEEQGRDLDRALALATAGRCRALIAGARGQLDVAADRLDRALVDHARTEQPFETGRTLLVAGEVQRRM